jgi:predicted dehydrogenase
MADLLRWLMGDVERIAALVDTWKEGIDVPDNVSALFRFKSGATGILELSWTLPSGAGLLEVYGDQGTLRQGFSSDKPIELIQRVDGEMRATVEKPAAGVPNSFENFAAAIRGEAPSMTPGEYGRRALALCDTMVRSSEAGTFVQVPHFETA